MTGPRAALLLLAVPLVAPLAGCGKVGPPRQPGPPSAITYPRSYPMREPPLLPPGATAPAPAPAPAPGAGPVPQGPARGAAAAISAPAQGRTEPETR